MKYICDAPDRKTWFRIETIVEAEQESALMDHSVEKHFRRDREMTVETFKPASTVYIEQEIGLEAHIQREMALFLTLRDAEGNGLATAMLPPRGLADPHFHIIVVGAKNSDPYRNNKNAIDALADHFSLSLDRENCFPYRKHEPDQAGTTIRQPKS